MAVNNFVAKIIYEDFFRDFVKIPSTGFYRFAIEKITPEQLHRTIMRCDSAGQVVYDKDILGFLDKIVNPGRKSAEWSYLPLGCLAPGEVVHIHGVKSHSDASADVELMKLNSYQYLNLHPSDAEERVPANDIVELAAHTVLEYHKKLSIAGVDMEVNLVEILLPTSFHRHLDRLLLPDTYLEATPADMLPLLNMIEELHHAGILAREFAGVLDMTAGCGVSTFVVRKLLNYFSGQDDE